MTRINVGIDPKELPTKLLLAEHREIKRIPNAIKASRISFKDMPSQFTLGKGHVKFFYTRIAYLSKRYWSIYKECIHRNLNVQFYGDAFNDIEPYYMNEYQPTQRDRDLIIQRIHDRGFKLLSEDNR